MEKTLRYFAPILLKHQSHHQNGFRFLNPAHGTKAPVNYVENFLKSKRVIYFGEIHSNSKIIQMQESVLDLLVNEVRLQPELRSKVVVIMEHFAGPEHQRLLDTFMSKKQNVKMPMKCFIESYDRIGEEGHNLIPYSSLLEYARENSDVVEVKAGFIPRSYAKRLMKEGEKAGLAAAVSDGYLDPSKTYMEGTDNHYNFFESLISGRDLANPPSDRFRKIFPAQIIKDAAMASIVVKEIQLSAKNKILVICGSGHCEYRFGVPERVDVIPKEETCVISVRDVNHYDISWDSTSEDEQIVAGPFEKVDNFETQFPADLIFFYDESEELSEETLEAAEAAHGNGITTTEDATTIKVEIADAYDKVSQTAHIKGDSGLAATVMKYLDYSDEQISIAGPDAFNYQGVGNPHKHADIKPGQHVLDLGSGLGVDSFIAADRVGAGGQVTGLDISKGEVTHATKRAKSRALDQRVRFVAADMEEMPLPDASIDVVISNGAFCLAPNKEKAFREIHRVLKPGGHFSVACTTLLKDLDPGIYWPICMRVFMPLKNSKPMLDEIGFIEVEIDSSNSLMVYSLESEGPSNASSGSHDETSDSNSGERKKIHVGSEEFKHLQELDMNELCARVILHGKKPHV